MSGLLSINVPRARGRGGISLPLANMAIREYFDDDDPGEAPLAEWQTKPELPTVNEIMGTEHPGKEFNLVTNKIDGSWPSTDLYLKTHYSLLREDAVANLRDAVASFCERPGTIDNKSFVIYERVYFTHIIMAHRGMAFRACFSTRRAGKRILWGYSPRLITGNIVALSPANDMFSSKCVVAVVAARPLEGVSKNPPEVDLFFAHPEDMDFDPLKEWIMVESRSGYYEAHRYTMTALQKLSRESFPLSNHICGLERKIDVPEYIASRSAVDLRAFPLADSRVESRYNRTGDSREAALKQLNIYQQNAMKHMLANKLAIVQGPPGTGKTFVSIAVLRLLLAQMGHGDPPIIIATHTNHALDQLLTQIAVFEPNYIRLGGRSKNFKVYARTLFAIKDSQPPTNLQNGLLSKGRKQHAALVTDIIQNTLKGFHQQSGDRSGSAFVHHGLLTEEQLNILEDDSNQWVTFTSQRHSDPFVAWLGDQALRFEEFCSDKEINAKIDDCDQDYEMLMEVEAEQAPNADEWECLKGKTVDLRATFPVRIFRTRHVPAQAIEEYLKFRDLWEIPREHRGAVYNELHRRLVSIVRKELREKAKLYMSNSRTLQIGKFECDYETLKTAKLIGMTTTGLSKYRGLVSALKPHVVMIEEAAEVIEAPVAVACFESLQHLILMGDHKQLKGHCAVHDLAAEPYNLDVSMFERLVQNNFPFVMLKEQRRMAPEIRRLLNPIYDELEDHESVSKFDPVPGMGDLRSFFCDHTWPEVDDSLTSKVNEIEALLVCELYCYLCLNGVPSSKITILTFYNGQRKKILKMLMDNENTRRHDPIVVTVDSYQGEENDIVILSLVRSRDGPSDGIGFLAVDNRVCVAFSRARRGLYIFGNSRHLAAASELWKQIKYILEVGEQGAPRIGNGIPVTCKHGKTMTMSSIRDWHKTNGGCEEMCGAILDCRHKCPHRCHQFPHSSVTCTQPCQYKQPCCGKQCSGYKCQETHYHSCDCSAIPALSAVSHRGNIFSPPVPPNSRSSTEEPEARLLINFSEGDTLDDSTSVDKVTKARISTERWTKFANGGARESNLALNDLAKNKEGEVPVRKTHLMDAAEEGVEVCKGATLKPMVKEGVQHKAQAGSKPELHKPVLVRHLLD